MRVPFGSSKMSARSCGQNSPSMPPSGVTFTFCAKAGRAARAATVAAIGMNRCVMQSSCSGSGASVEARYCHTKAMSRTGFAHLPLHTGRAPPWLFERMGPLAREIVTHIVQEYGPLEILRRLSDPYWFQALGCGLGFDWHSSGLTTTVCGALKEGGGGLERGLGLPVAGGKGATSRKTPAEITKACEKLGREPQPLVHASRISAKVDSAAVQDGYQLYHHSFVFTPQGDWCIVQQGMNEENAMARRYHWLSESVESYVNEPHAAVCCDARQPALNLVASESASARARSAELARERPETTLEALGYLPTLDLP